MVFAEPSPLLLSLLTPWVKKSMVKKRILILVLSIAVIVCGYYFCWC